VRRKSAVGSEQLAVASQSEDRRQNRSQQLPVGRPPQKILRNMKLTMGCVTMVRSFESKSILTVSNKLDRQSDSANP